MNKIDKNNIGLIRQPAVAGGFYPADSLALRKLINELFNSVPNRANIKGIRAIIVPHAGYVYSGIVAAGVYKLLRGLSIDRIVLLGPSHHIGFNFAGLTISKFWQMPFGQIEVDQEFNEKLMDNRHFKFLEDAHLQEHSLEVQLPFLQTIFYKRAFKLIPIVLGSDTNYEKIGKRLAELIAPNDRTLVVASTDLSHYFTQDQANFLDKNTIKFILSQNSKDIEHEADACGLEAVLVLNEIAKIKIWKPKLIDYKTSGDITGDLSAVVGYAGFIYK